MCIGRSLHKAPQNLLFNRYHAPCALRYALADQQHGEFLKTNIKPRGCHTLRFVVATRRQHGERWLREDVEQASWKCTRRYYVDEALRTDATEGSPSKWRLRRQQKPSSSSSPNGQANRAERAKRAKPRAESREQASRVSPIRASYLAESQRAEEQEPKSQRATSRVPPKFLPTSLPLGVHEATSSTTTINICFEDVVVSAPERRVREGE